jgi:hypothetical protein
MMKTKSSFLSCWGALVLLVLAGCSSPPSSETAGGIDAPAALEDGVTGTAGSGLTIIRNSCFTSCFGWHQCDSNGSCVACGAPGQPPCTTAGLEQGCQGWNQASNLTVSLTSNSPAYVSTPASPIVCKSCGGTYEIECWNKKQWPAFATSASEEQGCNTGEVLDEWSLCRPACPGDTVAKNGVCVDCGDAGEPACDGGRCFTGTVNVGGTCECGHTGQPACAGSVPCIDGGGW